jgi:hypothetical protein
MKMNQERQIPEWLVPELKRQGYESPRIEVRDGRLYFGTDPWADCDWCGSVRDTGEFQGCPFCLADCAIRERERWEAIRREALFESLFESFVPTQFH